MLVYLHCDEDGEEWVREVEAVPRVGDIIDRGQRNYAVVATHWRDEHYNEPYKRIEGGQRVVGMDVKARMVPHLVVREMQ